MDKIHLFHLSVCTATVLIFFTTATGTRIVSADLFPLNDGDLFLCNLTRSRFGNGICYLNSFRVGSLFGRVWFPCLKVSDRYCCSVFLWFPSPSRVKGFFLCIVVLVGNFIEFFFRNFFFALCSFAFAGI